MRLLKRTIQWTIGIICGLYFCLQIAMHIPPIQKWVGSAASQVLHGMWDWDISIGRIRLGLWNRVIIDDITLKDKQDSTMLHASRLAVKLEIIPLLDGKISIANAQLFGTKANLYQRSEQEKPNFQFILDTFKSDNTESNPINLRIGNIVLRRIEAKWDKQWMPHQETGTFDPSHIHLKDFALTARLKILDADTLNLSLRRLSFKEASGFELSNIASDFSFGSNGAKIENLKITLPHSTLDIPSFMATWLDTPKDSDIKKWLGTISWYAETQIQLTPSDFKAFIPRLINAHTPITLTSKMYGMEECINVPQLNLTNNGSLDLAAKLFVNDYINKPEYIVEINRLQANSHLQHYITQELNGQSKEISPLLTRLDTINLSGRLNISNHRQYGTIHISNRLANIDITADSYDWNKFNFSVSTSKIQLDKLLSDNGIHALDEATLQLNANGLIKDNNGNPSIDIRGVLPELIVLDKEYLDTEILAHIKDKTFSLKADITEPDAGIIAHASWKQDTKHHVTAGLNISKYATDRLALGHRYPNKRISMNMALDLHGNTIDDLNGSLHINDMVLENLNMDTTTVGPLNLSVITEYNKHKERTLSVKSENINLFAKGRFRFSTLATTIQNTLHYQLPNLIAYKKTPYKADTIQFNADILDTTILQNILLKDIYIPEKASISGEIRGYDSISVYANIPHLYFGNEELRNSQIRIKGKSNIIESDFSTERRQKNAFVNWALTANAANNRLRTIASMDNNRSPRFSGKMDITTNFKKTADGKDWIEAWIAPEMLTISDTLWHINPATIKWENSVASIRGFSIYQSKHRGLSINGCISSNKEDTLTLKLQDINVDYILNLVNFRSVEFSGFATGTATATNVLSSPNASVDLRVDNFCFNKAPQGTLNAHAIWGEQPHWLGLDAIITDEANNHRTDIEGGFSIGNKKRLDGLDLRVETIGFNLAFINHFTKDILENFQGRATGKCRIFGPFKGIDLEGDLMLDYADCKLPMLGTRYHIRQDSVHLTPGSIRIDALLIDNTVNPIVRPNWNHQTSTSNPFPHTAILHGELNHNHFKNLTYDFKIKANKLLGYDFREFGENSFYATCIASGNISVSGIPGRLNVNVKATPEEGTTFTYNVSTPEALTEAGFLTIKEYSETGSNDIIVNPSAINPSATTATGHNKSIKTEKTPEESTSSDLHLNFDLQITPAAKIRLLMDRKSGDMIEIMGRGLIGARYHNKGRFNIFGTYRVEDGKYGLSIQDIIRRDFRFQPGGRIVFGGDAMKADLNLKAIYSVHGVSLDDLTTNPLGFSKTRVDCIMNLTGRPEQPMVSFDFELPNAAEDEKQMVRSIVSTEEERNMQAIYLLGLGRFYNMEANSDFQSTTAVNSLLSTTLSSQLNQFISSAVGTSNWNFGTSLKTGEDGWRNMDVEGMLSGQLLDNRLLLSGNFGYREKYYTQRNFISDVSVEYLLTKNGNISLKAYNQANDRYFVQSSMNTQGVGIQFKKDFNRFSDLFMWLLPKKTEKEDTNKK